jgi:hypothetical protein
LIASAIYSEIKLLPRVTFVHCEACDVSVCLPKTGVDQLLMSLDVAERQFRVGAVLNGGVGRSAAADLAVELKLDVFGRRRRTSPFRYPAIIP